MKKITESELKNRVNKLREYMAEMGGSGSGQLAGKTAAPAADPAKIQAEIDRFSKGNDMNLAANKQYVAGLQAKLGGANTAAAPAGTAAGKTWPKDPTAIKAFQTANKLTPDGLIGVKTYTALTQQGYKAPPGFTVVAYKQPAKPANTAPTPAGTTAATPATGQTFAQNVAANKDAMKPGGATPPAQPGLPASVPGSVADITKQAASAPASPTAAAPAGTAATPATTPAAPSAASASGPGLDKLKAALKTGDQTQITQALAGMGEPDSFSPEEKQYADIANKAVGSGINAIKQDTRGGISKFLGINDPNAGDPQKAATQATVAAMTPPANTAAAPAGTTTPEPAAAPAAAPSPYALTPKSGSVGLKVPTAESVSYAEDQALARIIQLARG